MPRGTTNAGTFLDRSSAVRLRYTVKCVNSLFGVAVWLAFASLVLIWHLGSILSPYEHLGLVEVYKTCLGPPTYIEPFFNHQPALLVLAKHLQNLYLEQKSSNSCQLSTGRLLQSYSSVSDDMGKQAMLSTIDLKAHHAVGIRKSLISDLHND
jgi:hypothetical protein